MYVMDCAGGPVLHGTAAHSTASTPRLQPLVRPDQADAEGNSQHSVRVLYEPDRRQLHDQHATAATLQRLRAQLPRHRRAGHHLQQHPVPAHGQQQVRGPYYISTLTAGVWSANRSQTSRPSVYTCPHVTSFRRVYSITPPAHRRRW